MKTLTIFTPTYNRAHLLSRLYESLKNQTSKDFLWLVIDDGSIDDTKKVISEFQKENILEIEYILQENQGMHGAHNTAYEYIKTELNTCIDSDDLMPPDAVEIILKTWNTENKTKNIAGIVGLDADLSGTIIGTKFKVDRTTLEDFYRSGGKGDKKLVYRTDIIRKYPSYPIFEGEKYVGLAYKYLLIDQDYQLMTVNKILTLVDYQAEGSSNNMYRQYYRNPKGFAFLRKENMKLLKSKRRKFIESIHYVAESLLAKNKSFFSESPRKVLTMLALPTGILLYFYILYKNRTVSESTEL